MIGLSVGDVMLVKFTDPEATTRRGVITRVDGNVLWIDIHGISVVMAFKNSFRNTWEGRIRNTDPPWGYLYTYFTTVPLPVSASCIRELEKEVINEKA
jgi:hypothetical protein